MLSLKELALRVLTGSRNQMVVGTGLESRKYLVWSGVGLALELKMMAVEGH